MSGPDELALDWERIRAVGLDLMDTLLHDPFREVIPRLTGLTLEELSSRRDRAAYHEFELGLMSEREFGRRFFLDGRGPPVDGAALWEALDRGYRFLPGMERLALRLAARVPVHVLTNFSPWYERLRARFALDRFVDGHLSSYALGARKPDPAYYERALARAGLAPGELVFVDDRSANVEGARAAGIPSILFAGAEALEERLRPLLARPRRRSAR